MALPLEATPPTPGALPPNHHGLIGLVLHSKDPMIVHPGDGMTTLQMSDIDDVDSQKRIPTSLL